MTEPGPDEAPQLQYNHKSRVYKIGLSQKSAQLIQSDVPNTECSLYTVSEGPVSAVRLLDARRITWYVVISLGAIVLWVAGAWVLRVWQRGVAILE